MVTETQPELPSSVLRRLKVLGDDIMNASPKEINAMQSPNDHPNQIFADREAAIRKMAQELKPKLIRDEAPADGNCLFHAVAEQTIGKGEHMTVRASVVEEVNENRPRYMDFSVELEEWIDAMGKKGVWGDGIAAKACSNVYMSPVIVWRRQNPLQEPSIFLADNPESDRSPPILLELDEPTEGAEHYSPLKVAIVPENETAEEDWPFSLLDNAPVLPSAKDPSEAPSDVDVKAPSVPPIMDTSDAIQTSRRNSDSEKSSSTQPILGTSDEIRRELFPDLSKADKRETSHDEPRATKKMKMEFGLCGEVGRISSPIEVGATCCRCKSPLEVDKYRVVGKQNTVYMCNVCNCRGCQLNKIYGKWPPTRFKDLTEDQITEIWQEIKTKRNSKDLKVFIDEILEISKSDQAVSEDKTESLPMSVWKARGFEEKLIATWDTIEHPKMGTCYTLSLNCKFDRECEEFKRSQVIKVGDPPIRAPAAKMIPAPPKGQSKEEKEEAREQIRQSKANATQLARVQKQLKSNATKFLPKVVKAQFNISSLLSGKPGKMLSETDRKDGQRLKTELTATDKKLRSILVGKEKVDFDETMCDQLCNSAEAWRARAVEVISTTSMQL